MIVHAWLQGLSTLDFTSDFYLVVDTVCNICVSIQEEALESKPSEGDSHYCLLIQYPWSLLGYCLSPTWIEIQTPVFHHRTCRTTLQIGPSARSLPFLTDKGLAHDLSLSNQCLSPGIVTPELRSKDGLSHRIHSFQQQNSRETAKLFLLVPS